MCETELMMDDIKNLRANLAHVESVTAKERSIYAARLHALVDEVTVCNKRRFVAESELRDRGIRIMLPLA